MNDRIENYINDLLGYLVIEEKMKERITRDLRSHINEAVIHEDLETVLNRMGSPKEMAREFMDSIYEDKDAVIEQLIRERTKLKKLTGYYEYRSKMEFYGWPLVHIHFQRNLGARPAVAKGIIAIGNVAVGLIAIGEFALGGLCIAGISAGLISIAGLSIGVLAFGGMSVGVLAIGGLAIGLEAIGGVAIGNIAIGGYAKGIVAIGRKAFGQYTLTGKELESFKLGSSAKELVQSLIRTAFPGLNEWLVRIYTFFIY